MVNMVSRDYCCCAVPLYNVGIYGIFLWNVILGVLLGVLAFAAPHITALSIPSIAPYIFGVLAFLLALSQGAGFFGVFKEKLKIFRTYTLANGALCAVASLLALIIIIVSAVNHNNAVSTCVEQFVTQTGSNSTTTVGTSTGTLISAADSGTSGTGQQLCNIWVWVQMGIMFFLWAIVTATQIYFYLLTRSYAIVQKRDHLKYNSIYSQAGEIVRQSRIWDAQSVRGSLDGGGGPGETSPLTPGSHGRTASNVSKSSRLRNEVRVGHGDEEVLGGEYPKYRDVDEGGMDRGGVGGGSGHDRSLSAGGLVGAGSGGNVAPFRSSPLSGGGKGVHDRSASIDPLMGSGDGGSTAGTAAGGGSRHGPGHDRQSRSVSYYPDYSNDHWKPGAAR